MQDEPGTHLIEAGRGSALDAHMSNSDLQNGHHTANGSFAPPSSFTEPYGAQHRLVICCFTQCWPQLDTLAHYQLCCHAACASISRAKPTKCRCDRHSMRSWTPAVGC